MNNMTESSVCLSCTGKNNIYNIFDTCVCEGNEEIYADMLKQCFQIEITPESGLNTMCETCILKLRDAYYFKCEIIRAINELKKASIQLEDLSETSDHESVEHYDISPELDPETGQMRYVVSANNGETDENLVPVKDMSRSKAKKKVTWADSYNSGDEMDCSKENALKQKQTKPFTIKPGQTECAVCHTEFQRPKALYEHMNSHYPHHACGMCDKKFACENRLKRHSWTHMQGPFPCTICDKVFTKLNTRNAHIWRVHQTKEPYLCSECGERFKTFHGRLKHMQQSHGLDAKYPCPQCDRKYFSAGARSQHIRLSHLRERRYLCANCPMAFSKRRELLSHMANSHGIGEKRHKCDKCHKQFYRSTTLKYHLKTHERRERYTCTVCNAQFATKPAQRCHMKSHESSNPVREEDVVVEDRIFEGSNDTVYLEFCVENKYKS